MQVKLTKTQKIKLANSTDLYKIMREVLLRENRLDRMKEHFWIACLATNNKLLMIELVSVGSSKGTVVEATEVFGFALQKLASKLIMVHNHPSGELYPSQADKKLTEKMAAIGKFVNVPVIDHMIITVKGYYSFTDTGLLQRIMAETHYDLTFEQIDRLKEQMANAEKLAARKLELAEGKLKYKDEMLKREVEKGRKKDEKLKEATVTLKEKDERLKVEVGRTNKTVLALKKEKMSPEKIATITGLSKEQVAKIK